ncbi:SGNH/GDSL hydrolase family protein [Pseudomonas protegens]|uniref:SGNH/GDSL hydrolase family protein n=1 Tax=Pseudomonas protegens TaxID=380021 RepID=UPI0031589816
MKKLTESLPNTKATAMLALALTTSAMPVAPALAADASPTPIWVATWQASPQPVWGADFLFPTNLPPELRDQTVRQMARVSLGGSRLRIVLSNVYGKQPLTVGKATVARPRQGSGDGAVADGSLHTVTFGGQEAATILPGASLVSDPVTLPVPALSPVAVSLYLPSVTPINTFHWDGRQTGWIVSGDQTQASTLRMMDRAKQSTTARPLLTGIQVEAGQAARAVAVIGDSITDGATASLDKDSRWTDFLAARLAPHGVAVVNAGISGARLLSDGMGVNALARLERDVLAQPGVRSVIVMLGINDISWPGTAFAKNDDRPTLESLTAGYRQLIAQAHSRGIRVVGATLTPFEGALPDTPLADYYHPGKDALRQQVNEWIRHGGAFDAVIDFDAALRDPVHPARIASRFDSGDRLHPGDEGNRAMANAVALDALLPGIGAAPAPAATPTASSHQEP